jgi:hypothetical protein
LLYRLARAIEPSQLVLGLPYLHLSCAITCGAISVLGVKPAIAAAILTVRSLSFFARRFFLFEDVKSSLKIEHNAGI